MIAIDTRKLPCPFYQTDDGHKAWTALPGDRYIVTGVDRAGRRFRQEYSSFAMARAINVWQGSRWLQRGGRRWLIGRIIN